MPKSNFNGSQIKNWYFNGQKVNIAYFNGVKVFPSLEYIVSYSSIEQPTTITNTYYSYNELKAALKDITDNNTNIYLDIVERE